MSHQVQIDYQGIAIQCESICEVAERRLAELDEILTKAKEASSSLMKDRAAVLAQEMEREKEELVQQIGALKERAAIVGKRGVVYVDFDAVAKRNRTEENIVSAADTLRKTSDRLASERLIEFQSLLHTLLGENIEESYRKMRERNNGAVTIDEATKKILDSITDSTLKQFTYLAYITDNALVGDKLIAAGKALMDQTVKATYELRYEQEAAKIRAELEAAKVDSETVKKITDEAQGTTQEKLTAMREAATQGIVGEKVRQKSLRIIMKAIGERGFIVDKKNIKIKRDTNEVILVALKASGEKAEFRVFLDGKFMYDFRGYEGQACQRDIEPFMHDLEEVYGIKVTKQTEIWSNPDKISTMKYQAINTNKNKK